MRSVSQIRFATHFSLIVLCTCAGFLPPAHGWGVTGHALVPELAAKLVFEDAKTPALKKWGELLKRNATALGHYAFVPDALFKTDKQTSKSESVTHYFDSDFGFPLEKIPLETKAAEQYFLKETGEAGFEKVGSLPWRARQLYDLAKEQFSQIKELPLGENHESLERLSGDLKLTFNGLYLLGILAHYTGDAGVPFHGVEDFDGKKTGNRGIHLHYEEACVDYYANDLLQEAYTEAKERRADFLKSWHPDQLSVEALFLKILKGHAAKASEILLADHQLASVAPTWRKPVYTGCKAFKRSLTEQLAIAIVLTAEVWERTFNLKAKLPDTQSGGPNQEAVHFEAIKKEHPFIKPTYLK